jgi:hypothetical protein
MNRVVVQLARERTAKLVRAIIIESPYAILREPLTMVLESISDV